MLDPPPVHTNDQFVHLRIIHPLVVGARGSRGSDEIDVAFRRQRQPRMARPRNIGSIASDVRILSTASATSFVTQTDHMACPLEASS